MHLKYLLSWIAVIVVALVGDRILGFGVESTVNHSDLRFSRMYSGRMNADVLVLGNSRAVNTLYAPSLAEELALRVDSLAYNGVNAEVAEALALDALDHGVKPEWALIEVTTVQGPPSVLNDLRLYQRQSARLDALLATHFSDTANASRVSWLYSKNTELLLRAAYYHQTSDLTWINHYQIPEDLVESTRHMAPVAFEHSAVNNRKLGELVGTLEGRGVKVCLLLGPYLDVYLNKISNLKTWLAAVQAAVGPEHPILDLSDSLKSHEMFADRIHSNIRGASVVSKRVADSIRDGACRKPR